MNNIEISIITSLFKGGDFIEPFLYDITNQSVFDECELLIIGGNSPHKKIEEYYIKQFQHKFGNISYCPLPEDPGIYGVWNVGVNNSSGKYLTNANIDDRKHKQNLEIMRNELDANPEIDLVYAENLETHRPNETFENNSAQMKFPSLPFSVENMFQVNSPHNNPMWRRSLHHRFGLFDASYRSAGDYELWLRAATQGAKFKKIELALGLYYRNPEGISSKKEYIDYNIQEFNEIKEKFRTT